MKAILAFLIGLSAVSVGVAQTAIVRGMSEKDLMAAKGAPTNTVSSGNKAIYTWPDMVVDVTDGKVVSTRIRDVAAEKAAADERAAKAEQAKKKAAADAHEKQLLASAAQAARMKAAWDEEQTQARVRAMREGWDKTDSLRNEISLLNRELAQAKAQHEGQKAVDIQAVISSKQRELRDMSR